MYSTYRSSFKTGRAINQTILRPNTRLCCSDLV